MPNKEEVTKLNQGVNYMDQNQHPVPPVEPVSVPVEPVQQPVVEPVQPNQQPIVNTVALNAQAGNVVDSTKNGFNTIVDKMKKDKGLLIGAIAGAVVIFILLVFVASKILNPSYNVVNKYMNIMKNGKAEKIVKLYHKDIIDGRYDDEDELIEKFEEQLEELEEDDTKIKRFKIRECENYSKDELEDLSFQYLDPYAYSEIEHILEIKKEEREEFIETIKTRIATRFKNEEFIEPPEIDGRVKSVYSIYKKIFINHKEIDEIYDKYAVRIIVSTIGECYNVLGLIHDMFRPLPNRFKDYISTPKSNMYQSLHTTVLGREGIPFEVQIRTWDMHETAEYGIAAHWKYKEGIQGTDKMEQRLAWVRQVIEAQQTSDDVEEIVRIIKTDLAPEDIIVMTPKGDSISLPMDSTVID